MSLRFFVDQCVPNSVIKPLFEPGYEIFVLKNISHPLLGTHRYWKSSGDGGNTNFSKRGFSDIVTYPLSNYKGIIEIQVKNHPEIILKLMKRLMNYLSIILPG